MRKPPLPLVLRTQSDPWPARSSNVGPLLGPSPFADAMTTSFVPSPSRSPTAALFHIECLATAVDVITPESATRSPAIVQALSFQLASGITTSGTPSPV